MDDRLKQYLNECKAKKLSWDQVEHVMEGSNYPAETVAEAKAWYGMEMAAETTVKPIKPAKKMKWIFWIIGLLILIGLLGGGGFGTLYMVGTQKLTLPNQNLQTAAEKMALSIPGVPKNPKVIYEMGKEALKKVSKASFEMSLSGQLQASEIESLLGSKTLDAQIKGYSDMSDSLNPKFSMNLIFGKEVDVDIRKPDKVMYVKVNKLPVALYAILGIDPIKLKPLWDNWIGVDTSSPDTSARKKLDEELKNKNSQPEATQLTEDLMNKIMTEDIFPSLVTTEDKHDGVETYKIVFDAKPEQINKIVREIAGNDTKMSVNPADILKSLKVTVWVEKKDMLVLETGISGSVEMDKNSSPLTSPLTPVLGLTSEKQKIDFAIVMKLNDFGKDMAIQKPDKYLSPEEFLSEFMKLQPEGLLGGLLNPSKQFAQARNSKRMQDTSVILKAIFAYDTDNKNEIVAKVPLLPTKISKNGLDLCTKLVPKYISQLPADPTINTQILDCKTTYDTGYEIRKDTTGKITVTAPMAENGQTVSMSR